MTAKKVLKDREAFEKMKMLSIYFLGLFFQTLFCVLFFLIKHSVIGLYIKSQGLICFTEQNICFL